MNGVRRGDAHHRPPGRVILGGHVRAEQATCHALPCQIRRPSEAGRRDVGFPKQVASSLLAGQA